jgi:hypothetical protein
MSTRRERFCDIYEGYGTVCDCDNPQQLEFPPVPVSSLCIYTLYIDIH